MIFNLCGSRPLYTTYVIIKHCFEKTCLGNMLTSYNLTTMVSMKEALCLFPMKIFLGYPCLAKAILQVSQHMLFFYSAIIKDAFCSIERSIPFLTSAYTPV